VFQKLKAIVKISRPINFFIVFFSIVVACFISAGYEIISLKVFLTAFSGALSISAGNIINDYFDIEIDRQNRPNRVLPAGILSLQTALILYIIFAIIPLLISIYLSSSSFILMTVFTIIIFFYSYKFKRIPLLGNFIVAFVLGVIGFIYAGLVFDNLTAVVIPAVFAFLINFIREIIKDMEDIEGDIKQNVITFPSRYGYGKSKFIVLLTAVVLILLTIIIFILHVYKIEFFILVMITVNPLLVYFLKSLYENDERKNLERLSNLLKICMVAGLIAIYIGK
jgi:geranylgeranylglycerol-phosphate geranylgeranyltransferase